MQTQYSSSHLSTFSVSENTIISYSVSRSQSSILMSKIMSTPDIVNLPKAREKHNSSFAFSRVANLPVAVIKCGK